MSGTPLSAAAGAIGEAFARPATTGYFELNSDTAGRFTFNLKAGNHEVILTSKVYKTRQDALHDIEAVRRNSLIAKRFERSVAKDNSIFFVLRADNGQTLGRSEMYTTRAAMENGIQSVMAHGGSTFVKGLG
jgi:uncharacterized protein